MRERLLSQSRIFWIVGFFLLSCTPETTPPTVTEPVDPPGLAQSTTEIPASITFKAYDTLPARPGPAVQFDGGSRYLTGRTQPTAEAGGAITAQVWFETHRTPEPDKAPPVVELQFWRAGSPEAAHIWQAPIETSHGDTEKAPLPLHLRATLPLASAA